MGMILVPSLLSGLRNRFEIPDGLGPHCGIPAGPEGSLLSPEMSAVAFGRSVHGRNKGVLSSKSKSIFIPTECSILVREACPVAFYNEKSGFPMEVVCVCVHVFDFPDASCRQKIVTLLVFT